MEVGMYKIIGADGKEYGPISAEQLRQWVAEGRVNTATKVQTEGSAEWKQLVDFPEFAASPGERPPIQPAPGRIDSSPDQSTNMRKPGKLQAIAVMTLVMGILNILCGVYWLFAGLMMFLVGIVFTIIPASYLIVLGVLEIVTAAKLLANPVKLTQPPKYVAIMEIIAIVCCNAIALVIGILNLVFYNDEEVEQYFARIRG
jgi:hypothetical protein